LQEMPVAGADERVPVIRVDVADEIHTRIIARARRIAILRVQARYVIIASVLPRATMQSLNEERPLASGTRLIVFCR
jgi:hypothetical protein